jgi:hypothetical protein
MGSDVNNGIMSGLVGGVIFGIMMQMMSAPTPEGGQMPMMAMVAKVVRSDSMIVGWIYHLVNSAVIGAIFGWLLGNRFARFWCRAGMGRGVRFRMVDFGRINIDAALSRDAGFRAASDGANATGRDGKSGGSSDLRRYSRRRLRYVGAGNTRANPARVNT